MKPYEWMVKYTPQTEWIERRGLFMWLAEVFGGIGAGLYLVAIYFNSVWGMLAGWLIIIAFKGGFHLAYLGKPTRFWRMILKPQTSWIARGFIFMLSFIILGALQLIFSYWLPGTTAETVFMVLAGISAFLVAIYTGFAMNYVNGIQFWNSALLPLLFVLTGILDGLALVVAMGMLGVNIDIIAAEAASRALLIVSAVIITIYLWSATYTGLGGKQSVITLLRGSMAPLMWLGVVLCGIVLPIAISLFTYFAGEASAPWLIVAIICEMIGAFSLKYVILKVGTYEPLIPVSAY